MVGGRCKLVGATVGVALAVGLVEVCVLVPLYEKHEIIKSDNYTEGDTDVNSFDPFYCKAVEMTKSEQSTASLYLVSSRPQLSARDKLLAKLNTTMKPDDFFSDWSFHIHPGSNLTLSICTVTLDPSCELNQRDKMWFEIIWGEKNFSRWRGNMGNSKYVINSTGLPVSLRYCHRPFVATYHYVEEGDHWHVIRTFLGTCAVEVIANITIERTQYYNDRTHDLGVCEVPGEQGPHKCSIPVEKTHHSRVYTYLAVDETSTVTEWKNDIHVTLSCTPRYWIMGVGLAIAAVGILSVVAMCMGFYFWRRHNVQGYAHLQGENVIQDQQKADSITVSHGQPPPAVPIPNVATLEPIEDEPRSASAPAQQHTHHYAPKVNSSLRPLENEMEISGAHGSQSGGATDDSEAGAGSGATRESGGRGRRKRRGDRKSSRGDSARVIYKPQTGQSDN